MPDSQIENTGVAAVFTRRRLRNITLAFTVDPQVHPRMVDEKFVKRNLAMYQRLKLETHCEFVDLQEWWLVGKLAAMKGDVVQMGCERRQFEIELANLGSTASCVVRVLHNCAKRIFLEAATLQKQISSHGSGEN
jgi:hypothetical protein